MPAHAGGTAALDWDPKYDSFIRGWDETVPSKGLVGTDDDQSAYVTRAFDGLSSTHAKARTHFAVVFYSRAMVPTAGRSICSLARMRRAGTEREKQAQDRTQFYSFPSLVLRCFEMWLLKREH